MRPTTQTTRVACIALLCLSMGLRHATRAEAQSAALVRLVPGSATVGVGSTAAVQIRIENVVDLYGLDIRIEFDPAAVEVVDADETNDGVQLRPGELLKPDFVVRNQADNSAGSVWFAITQLNPSESVDGSGVVFSVLFRGKVAGGSSPLTFTYQTLASRTGEVIPASVEDGEIRVVAAAEAPPTPTVAPILPTATKVPPLPTQTVAPTDTLVPPPPRQPPTAVVPTVAATPTHTKVVLPSQTPAVTSSPTIEPTMPTESTPVVAIAPPSPTLAAQATVRQTATPERIATPRPSATPVLARSTSSWLIVYAALFGVAFLVTLLAMRARRKKQD